MKAVPAPADLAELDALVKASDFVSMQTRIGITNNTAKTELLGDDHVKLIEFSEDTLTLEVPKNVGSQGHNLTLNITVYDGSQSPLLLVCTGKIEAFEALENKIGKIVVRFIQYDVDAWRKFINTFSSRQDDIETFFRAARGY